MIGLKIKAVSSSKGSLLKALKEVIEEIENGSTSMYLPLNDKDNTEADFALCSVGELSIYDEWGECKVLTHGKQQAVEQVCASIPTDDHVGDARCKAIASDKGWKEGGGYIYDGNLFGSWKEAVSWAGDEDGNQDEQDSAVYGSWKECCDGEGFDYVT